jgi:hypothetical protein
VSSGIQFPSIETQQRIAALRLKARSPEGLTLDETKEAIAFLRQERLAMPVAKAGSRTKAPAPNADDLLSELGL